MTTQEALFNYCLRLADNHLILGHRLSELSSKGPLLEEDIACTNISLDLIGQANALLQYASSVENKGRNEDDLAFLRHERHFYNSLLSEQPNHDFAFTMVKQFLIDAFNFYLFDELKKSKDLTISALATKGHKEITYHLRHSSTWIDRLGLGTDESNKRTQNAINELWRFTDDMFVMDEADKILISEAIAIDLNTIKPKWHNTVNAAFEKANLKIPEKVWMQYGSKQGKHTEHLGFLLAEMQHLHRAYPGVKW